MSDSIAMEMTVNRLRLLNQLQALAKIGVTDDSSCCRLGLTDADRDGRHWVKQIMFALGLEVHIDGMTCRISALCLTLPCSDLLIARSPDSP